MCARAAVRAVSRLAPGGGARPPASQAAVGGSTPWAEHTPHPWAGRTVIGRRSRSRSRLPRGFAGADALQGGLGPLPVERRLVPVLAGLAPVPQPPRRVAAAALLERRRG